MGSEWFGLIELALVFGGVLLFGWHQIRSVRDRGEDETGSQGE